MILNNQTKPKSDRGGGGELVSYCIQRFPDVDT